MEKIQISLFYKYLSIDNIEEEKQNQFDLCTQYGLLGRILLSTEGINATLAGTEMNMRRYMMAMCDIKSSIYQMDLDEFKLSEQWIDMGNPLHRLPFPELKIKIVPEIVSTGNRVQLSAFDDTDKDGHYLLPEEFHQALVDQENEDTIVLDVRNHKEYLIGHFEKAVDPKVKNFSEYFQFLDQNIIQSSSTSKEETAAVTAAKQKKILMYCTGGIRCVKASTHLRQNGCRNVYQLKGGIHKYLEAYPDGGLFRGKNFVFDQRVNMPPSQTNSTTASIVGTCIECTQPYDTFRGKNVCTVCRDLVLICPDCVHKCRGEFHCDDHQYLKRCYFTFLQYFSPEELESQCRDLERILAHVQYEPKWKNKRNMLRKQICKIQMALVDEQPVEPRSTDYPCRSCQVVECDGNCWGFWKPAPASIP